MCISLVPSEEKLGEVWGRGYMCITVFEVMTSLITYIGSSVIEDTKYLKMHNYMNYGS